MLFGSRDVVFALGPLWSGRCQKALPDADRPCRGRTLLPQSAPGEAVALLSLRRLTCSNAPLRPQLGYGHGSSEGEFMPQRMGVVPFERLCDGNGKFINVSNSFDGLFLEIQVILFLNIFFSSFGY